MDSFSEKVKCMLKWYVYALIDPRSKEIFYIGKGNKDRIFEHEKEKYVETEGNKGKRIKNIIASGNEVEKVIIQYGLEENEAFAAEAAIINLMDFLKPGELTNVVAGQHSTQMMDVETIEKIYGAETICSAEIYHNLLVVKINSLYSYDMSIEQVMDCARGHWILNIENAQKADYLIAAYHGLVVGVYENMKWYSSGVETEFYPYLCEENLKLSNRKYCTCTPVTNSKYLNKNISEVVGNVQNPVSYIWGRKNTVKKLNPYYELLCEGNMNNRVFEENFGREMGMMGFQMDCFDRYKKSGYPEEILYSKNKEKLRAVIDKVDFLTATSMLFSQWRYLTHWAYVDYCRYEKDTEFFKLVLERIFEVSK